MASPKSVKDAATRDDEQSLDRTAHNGAAPHVPKTELGRRLMEIRTRIEASGHPLLSLEEFEREMAERRGVSWPDEE